MEYHRQSKSQALSGPSRSEMRRARNEESRISVYRSSKSRRKRLEREKTFSTSPSRNRRSKNYRLALNSNEDYHGQDQEFKGNQDKSRSQSKETNALRRPRRKRRRLASRSFRQSKESKVDSTDEDAEVSPRYQKLKKEGTPEYYAGLSRLEYGPVNQTYKPDLKNVTNLLSRTGTNDYSADFSYNTHHLRQSSFPPPPHARLPYHPPQTAYLRKKYPKTRHSQRRALGGDQHHYEKNSHARDTTTPNFHLYSHSQPYRYSQARKSQQQHHQQTYYYSNFTDKCSVNHKPYLNNSSPSFDSSCSNNYTSSSRKSITHHEHDYEYTKSRSRPNYSTTRLKSRSKRKYKRHRGDHEETESIHSMPLSHEDQRKRISHSYPSPSKAKDYHSKQYDIDSEDSDVKRRRYEKRRKRQKSDREYEKAYKLIEKYKRQRRRERELEKERERQHEYDRERGRKRGRETRSSHDSSHDNSRRRSRAKTYHRRRLYQRYSESTDRYYQKERKMKQSKSKFSRSNSRSKLYSQSQRRRRRTKRSKRAQSSSGESGKYGRNKFRSQSESTHNSASESERQYNKVEARRLYIRDRPRLRNSGKKRSRLSLRSSHNHESRNHHSNAVVSDYDLESEDVDRSNTNSQSVSDDGSNRASKSWFSSSSDDGKDTNTMGEVDDGSSSQRDDTIGHFKGGPGTVIKDRYEIIQDVGMGTFGRVVECMDLKSSNTSSRKISVSASSSSATSKRSRLRPNNVAIKIVRNVKRYHESALIEADILKDVNRRGGRGKSLCAKLLDHFDLKAGHCCLVFECLGMSLYDFLKSHDYTPFPMYCVRDFAHQLLDALEFLHGFDLIHTDLKPENILLVSNEEVAYKTRDGSRYMVPQSTKIKVIDFGGATYDNEKKSSVVNTRQYRAPEVILNLGWSTPSDLWSAGCIIAELFLGELLFATHDNAEHLALMESAIGAFPKSMLTRSNSAVARQAFDSSGHHKRERVLSPRKETHVRKMSSLEVLIDEGGIEGEDRGVTAKTKSMFVRLLRAMLSVDPKIRASASEGLESNYFKQEY